MRVSTEHVRIGTAGWAYPDWNGLLYPKPMPRGVDRLTYYAKYFDMVELNSSFYGPPAARVVDGWIQKVRERPGFRFTMKLYQRFTHERETAWTAAELTEVRVAPERFHGAGKLGALLMQFPWSFKNTSENWQWLEDLFAAFEDFPCVVEIRHESWNTPEFYAALHERGVGFVNIDQPVYKKSIKPSARVTSAIGYVRIHGRNYKEWWRRDSEEGRYNYLYPVDELEPWVDRIREIAKTTQETYVANNNHNLGKAGVNAAQIKALLLGKPSEVPPVLYEHYGEALRGYATAVD